MPEEDAVFRIPSPKGAYSDFPVKPFVPKERAERTFRESAGLARQKRPISSLRAGRREFPEHGKSAQVFENQGSWRKYWECSPVNESFCQIAPSPAWSNELNHLAQAGKITLGGCDGGFELSDQIGTPQFFPFSHLP